MCTEKEIVALTLGKRQMKTGIPVPNDADLEVLCVEIARRRKHDTPEGFVKAGVSVLSDYEDLAGVIPHDWSTSERV